MGQAILTGAMQSVRTAVIRHALACIYTRLVTYTKGASKLPNEHVVLTDRRFTSFTFQVNLDTMMQEFIIIAQGAGRMTLMDLFRLIRKYWVIVLAATLVCGAAGFGYTMLKHDVKDQISATANIVGNSQTGGVVGFAKAEGRKIVFDDEARFEDEDCEYELVVEVESGSQTVKVTVSGPDEGLCIDLANQIAEAACRQAKIEYPGSDYRLAYSGHVEKANTANVKEASGPSKKFIIAAILAGLFLGVCIVVIIDMKRRPIKSIEGMQEAVELPVLEKLPATNGERLLANVRFASKVDDLKRVCIIPLSKGNLADQVADLMRAAIESEQSVGESEASRESDDAVYDAFYVQVCAPFAESMSAAYESRSADAVIVVAHQWNDSLSDLETTVAELKLAEANVVGLVLAQE